MKKKNILAVLLLVVVALLSSCSKGNDSLTNDIPDEPITDKEAVLLFGNYTAAPSLQSGLNGKGTDICVIIISDQQPTTTISKNWGVKCDFFKSQIGDNKWHCLISIPENDKDIQRHAILSIHNGNKTIKLRLSQNTNANVEYGWKSTNVVTSGDDCDFHPDKASSVISVVSDSEDVTSGPVCTECNGTSLCQSCYLNPGTGKCKYCKGRGKWTEVIWTATVPQYCNVCDWTGKCTDCVGSGVCPKCYGLGVIDDRWRNN